MQKIGRVLLGNLRYIGLSFGVFALGLLLGALFAEQLQVVIQAGLDHLKEMAEQARAKDDPLYTAQMIFWNNLRATIFMLLLGSFYAVLTILMLLINGLMIGVVFALTQGEASASLVDLIVFGLLPHGIFELPAILIASAFGIKLGKVLIVPSSGKTRLQSYAGVWREVMQISWVLLLLLVVAAGIEGWITPQLLETYAR